MDWLIKALWGWRFRGKVRLLTRLAPASGTRTGRVFGARVPLDLSDYVQRMMYLGCFEREETALLRRYLRPGMAVVDAGANAGYFTFLAASSVGPAGRVVAVEPDPLLYAKLAGAIRTNGLQSVTALNVALGREAGELPLFVPPPAHANRSPTLAPVPGWEPVTVSVRTLDDVCRELCLDRVDLLKLDVEGFEGEVLAGAGDLLRSGRIRAILCEFNTYWLNEQETPPDRLWDVITGHGFRPSSPRPLFAPDGVANVFFTRG